MSARFGFTLLELLVALVLAGVVALLVYGAAAAGTDTAARLRAERRSVQAVRAFRATLEDALRNARPARQRGDTTFRLEARGDPQGRPYDRLSFVTAGALPPLTADADWAVTLEPTPEGLQLVAVPIGLAAPTPVVLRLPQFRGGLDIRVLTMGQVPEWSKRWIFPTLVPRAIALTFWTDSGPAGAPWHLTLPLGGVE